MTVKNRDRRLLTLAIIAFDLMVKDCIEHEAKEEPFHEESLRVLRHLTALLNNIPDWDHRQEQYVLNVAEISARIKLIFSSTAILEEDLEEMLVLQQERLKWLGKHVADEDSQTARQAMARSLH